MDPVLDLSVQFLQFASNLLNLGLVWNRTLLNSIIIPQCNISNRSFWRSPEQEPWEIVEHPESFQNSPMMPYLSESIKLILGDVSVPWTSGELKQIPQQQIWILVLGQIPLSGCLWTCLWFIQYSVRGRFLSVDWQTLWWTGSGLLRRRAEKIHQLVETKTHLEKTE